MGTSIFKWAHDSTFWRTTGKGKRLQTCLACFVTATVISSIAFHFLTQGQKFGATREFWRFGYAFITGGSWLLPNIWKEFFMHRKTGIIFSLILLASLMLLPIITGWISTWLHLSGIVSLPLVLSSAPAFRKILMNLLIHHDVKILQTFKEFYLDVFVSKYRSHTTSLCLM